VARKYSDPFYCTRKNTRPYRVVQELIKTAKLSFCTDPLSPDFEKWRLGPYKGGTAIGTVQLMYGHMGQNYILEAEHKAKAEKGKALVEAFKRKAGLCET
jgi:hypothetical protein